MCAWRRCGMGSVACLLVGVALGLLIAAMCRMGAE